MKMGKGTTIILIVVLLVGLYWFLGIPEGEAFKPLTPIISLGNLPTTIEQGVEYYVDITLDLTLPDPLADYNEYLYVIQNYYNFIKGKSFVLYKGGSLKSMAITDEFGHASLRLSETTLGTVSYTLSFEGSHLIHTWSRGITVEVVEGGIPPPEPTFSLSLATDTLTIVRSEYSSTHLTLASLNYYTGDITLSGDGVASGVNIEFAISSITLPPSENVDVDIAVTVDVTTVAGTYGRTITVTDGSITKEQTLTVIVQEIPAPVISISNPTEVGLGNDFTIDVSVVNMYKVSVIEFTIEFDNTIISDYYNDFTNCSFDNTAYTSGTNSFHVSLTMVSTTQTGSAELVTVSFHTVNVGASTLHFVKANFTYNYVLTLDTVGQDSQISVIDSSTYGSLYIKADSNDIADFDGNGYVDSEDGALFQEALNRYWANGYIILGDEKYDLDNNNIIDEDDLWILNKQILDTVVIKAILYEDVGFGYSKIWEKQPFSYEWHYVDDFVTGTHNFRLEILPSIEYAESTISVIEGRNEWEPTLTSTPLLMVLVSFGLFDAQITITLKDVALVMVIISVILLSFIAVKEYRKKK